MYLPQSGDYIDIHTHGSKSSRGIFLIENLMAHENIFPEHIRYQACSYGIHPWHLNAKNIDNLLFNVNASVGFTNLLAIGEAGFDKLKGPSMDLQKRAFEEQVSLSEKNRKPMIIHCVRAWDDLLASHKKLKPLMPWLIHGFRGSYELANQLLSRGMYVSFWYDFVLRAESAELLRALPHDKIFLETDGADVDIIIIYKKVAEDLNITVDDLRSSILSNFNMFFQSNIQGYQSAYP